MLPRPGVGTVQGQSFRKPLYDLELERIEVAGSVVFSNGKVTILGKRSQQSSALDRACRPGASIRYQNGTTNGTKRIGDCRIQIRISCRNVRYDGRWIYVRRIDKTWVSIIKTTALPRNSVEFAIYLEIRSPRIDIGRLHSKAAPDLALDADNEPRVISILPAV